MYHPRPGDLATRLGAGGSLGSRIDARRGDYEVRLPRLFRHLVRGAGARETKSPDLLSLLMFDPEYLKTLMAIGEADAEACADEIDALLKPARQSVGIA